MTLKEELELAEKMRITLNKFGIFLIKKDSYFTRKIKGRQLITIDFSNGYLPDKPMQNIYNKIRNKLSRNIKKTQKKFDLDKKMWRESYIIFNFFELLAFKSTSPYPNSKYEIIKKYKFKLYYNERSDTENRTNG